MTQFAVRFTWNVAKNASLETGTSVYAKPQNLEYYVRPNGTIPFNEWFSTVGSKEVRNAVDKRLFRLLQGNFGDHKRLDSELYELRLHLRPGYRIYFCKPKPNTVMLLHGGTKKDQQADIEEARFYFEESEEHHS